MQKKKKKVVHIVYTNVTFQLFKCQFYASCHAQGKVNSVADSCSATTLFLFFFFALAFGTAFAFAFAVTKWLQDLICSGDGDGDGAVVFRVPLHWRQL